MYSSKKCVANVSHKILFISQRHKTSQTTAEYCMNLVKNHDYENFISTLLLKKDARTCAFAVRSFNVEVSQISTTKVSQKQIGLMRFQFWEDALTKCFSTEFSEVPKHPVAIELFKAVHKHKLTKRNLRNLINSRKDHLGFSSFNTLDEMEKYLERSVSSNYYLILEGCGVKDINADHAGSHLGKAQGIVQQLRSLPLSKQLNFIPLPQDILVKNSISHEELFRFKSSKSLSDCVYEVASRAHQHLMKARNLQENVPVEARSAFLSAVPTSMYLDRLQKVDYDIFHPKLKHRQWNLLFQMWLTNFRKKY